MTKKIFASIALVLLILICSQNKGFSQYWGERVLEKSFEQMDFFFMPNYLNPYGLSNLSATTPGLIDDPLLNLIVNPANLYSDSSRKTYFYLDFRNSQIKQNKNYGYYPYLDARSSFSYDMIWYPNYFIQTRKALEPVFSTALLTRPLRSLDGLFLGVSYQLIFQNEGYYSVPQDIYRSNIGYDYAGNKVAETSNIPIVDRYKGADDMRQTGHFLSLFSGYEISPRLQLGFRLNRTAFERDGSYGSQNFWENPSTYKSTSVWYDMRWRHQNYNHWDVAGGLNFRLNDRTTIGFQGGRLSGDADQSLTQQDSSLYKSGQINVGNEWSYYWKQGGSGQRWEHEGNTAYGGLNIHHQLDATKSLLFYYAYHQQQADITLYSQLNDSSYSNYHYEWNPETDYYYSEWDYAVHDMRTGTGERSNKSHRFMGALQWEIERNKKLHIGLNVEFLKRRINTDEQVLLDRHSRSKYTSSYNPYRQNYFDATQEDKNLLWEFKADVVNFQIPIIFTWKISDAVEILLGLNRKMTNWDIDDMTLAIFKYRETTADSMTTKKTNFGERYTEPSEHRSDVQTTMLGGITISPSKLFNVRLLAVPNFTNTYAGTTLKEFQWWIGISLYP